MFLYDHFIDLNIKIEIKMILQDWIMNIAHSSRIKKNSANYSEFHILIKLQI